MTTSLPQRVSPFPSQLVETLSLRNERLFITVVLLSVAPLWIGPYLPLVDLPQHAAQVTALRLLLGGDWSFAALFQINWFTPYLLGYLSLYVLTLVLPITVATKLLVSGAVVAVPLLTGRLLRAVGGDESLKWLAIPCSFSFAFYWGFLTFLVTVPLALLFFIQTARFIAAPSPARAIAIATFSVLLFFCHVMVLGFASFVALGFVAGAHYRDWRVLVTRALPYTAPLPIIGIWLVSTFNAEDSVRNEPTIFGSFYLRMTLLLAQPAGREDLFSDLPVVVLVTLAVLSLPWLMGGTFSKDPKRWLPLALGASVFLLSPYYVLSTAYFYQRFGVFLVPLWLMAWEVPQARRRLDWAAIAVVVFWVVTSSGRFVAFARETESFRNIVAVMEPGRRAAGMVVDNLASNFTLPVYMHFPAWYQAEKGGVVDFSFAEFYSQMVRYRPAEGQRVNEIVSWFPKEFRWEAHGGDKYDYFVIKAKADVADTVFKERRSSVELVTQSGWWWLYRNVATRSTGSSVVIGAAGDDSSTRAR